MKIIASRILIIMPPNGVTGMMTTLRAVFGILMDGLRNIANGSMIIVGSITAVFSLL